MLAAFSTADDPEVIFIERAPTMRNHAGQIAFPGGGLEPGDDSLMDAALRETEEEVGLTSDRILVLGMLPAVWVPVSQFTVATAVARWQPSALRPQDPGEVAAVHQIRLSQLCDPASRVTSRHPSGHTGPAFVVGDVFVWGFTAMLLDRILELAGWNQPWDQTQTVAVPDRFLRD